MLHLSGCSAGSAALRLAKDLAENNRGARVLVACVELTVISFRGPNEEDCFDTLIRPGLFGDGAGAAIVCADPVYPVEVSVSHTVIPETEHVSVSQTVIPETEHLLTMQLGKGGIDGDISTKVPADNIEQRLLDAFGPLAIGAEWK